MDDSFLPWFFGFVLVEFNCLIELGGLIAFDRDGNYWRGILIAVTLPIVGLFYLLIINLGLAFQFGSCEIVKVLIRNKENTRTVKKLLQKQIQEETTES